MPSIYSILPVHFNHAQVELGAMFIGKNNLITIYATPNMGKMITGYELCDLGTALNFLDKIEPLN